MNSSKVPIEPSWKKALKDYFKLPEWKLLTQYIKKEYQEKKIYPHSKKIFNAFNLTPFEKVSVLIIGQDPYHNPDQAQGLSFSVPSGTIPPLSLKNIYKEIESDLKIKKDFSNGNLESWSRQGVLLLNSVLTVRENEPGSHANKGWELFTDYVVQRISDECEHVVFLLWGNYAKKKGVMVDTSKHLVLETSHPSPLGAHRGFTGCQHFSKTNKYLRTYNKQPIDW